MDVTNENLAEAVEDLAKWLPRAEFVAFDEEMTGIDCPGLPELRLQQWDTPEQRYRKMAAVASRFAVIQFGIAL